MRYFEAEQALRDLTAAAGAERCHKFGADMVVRMTSDAGMRDSARYEFDAAGQRAFAEACADPVNSDGHHLQALLARAEAGMLSEFEMDPRISFAIVALDDWSTYITKGDTNAIANMAIMSVELADPRVPTDLDDFLNTPKTAAEYARITALFA